MVLSVYHFIFRPSVEIGLQFTVIGPCILNLAFGLHRLFLFIKGMKLLASLVVSISLARRAAALIQRAL